MALTRPRYGQLDTRVITTSDPVTILNQGASSANVDVGFLFNRASGLVPNVALYWSEATQSIVTAYTNNNGVSDGNITVSTYANLTVGNVLLVEGSVIGVSGNIEGNTIGTHYGSVVADSIIWSNGTSIVSTIESIVSTANTTQSNQIEALKGQAYTNANVDAYLSSTGSGNIAISSGAFSLTATGPGATTVGSATAIPVITTDAYGRVVGLTSASVSSTLNTVGTSGTGTVSLTNQSLTFAGTNGVTASASGQTITVATPQDLQTNANVTFGGATIAGDLNVNGILTVNELRSTVAQEIIVQDPLLYMVSNVIYPWTFDTGIFSHARGGPANVYGHHGFVRSSEFGYWGFFSNVKSEPTTTINWLDSGIIWDKTKAGELVLANTTAATSTSTGALQVAGGAGIAGNIYAAGVVAAGVDLVANAGAQASAIAGANAAIVTANTSLKNYVDTQDSAITSAWTANAGAQASAIAGANAAIITANTALKNYVDGQITSLVGGAPAVLDTLYEISNSLGNNASLSSTLLNSIAGANAAIATLQTQVYSNSNVNAYLTSGSAGNVSISNGNITLPLTGPGAKNVGSSTSIPTIVTDAYGRIVSLTSNAVSTTITLAGTSGSGSVAGGGTLTFAGSNGFTATASGSTITLSTPQDVRSTATPTFAGITTNGNTIVNSTAYVSGGVYTTGLYWSANGNVMASGITYTASSTAPASANKGDQWYNTSSDILYEYINDGASSYWIDTSSASINTSSAAGIAANLNPVINGNIYITGNLVPTSNVAYDLGSPTNAFKSLFLSGNTIHLGGAMITTDQSTGAIAMVPIPTVANPNPKGMVIDPSGYISQITTTAGRFTASALATVVTSATTAGSNFSNITVGTTAAVGRVVTTNGVFWANGINYSSTIPGTYSNSTVASYLPVYSGNVASGNASVTTKLTAGNIVTTNGVFWANGTAYSSGSGGTTLPSQSGNSGKYLTTDGSSLSWGTVAGGGGGGTTTNAITIGDGLATQDGDKLFTWLPPNDHRDRLGRSVATNGTYTVVAATDDNGNSRGYVNVYLNATGALQYKITISSAYFLGQTPAGVAINSNNIISVGEITYNSNAGRVFVFDMATWSSYTGTTISITSATTTITNPTAGSSNFGRAIAMSAAYIVIGCDQTTVSGSSYAGAVYLYNMTGSLMYKITNPNSYGNMGGDQFGWSVAINGFTLVVGAYAQDDATVSVDGTVYVFNTANFPTYSGTTVNITSANYTSYGFAIPVPDPVANIPSYMGYSVATNGTYVIAGAPWTRGISRINQTPKQYVGSVYVFNATTGSLLYKFGSPIPVTNGGQTFGYVVSVSGNNLLVGEPFEDTTGFAGTVYLYNLATGKLKKTIYSPNAVGNYNDTDPKDEFGSSISISGNYAVVGAPSEKSTPTYTSSAGGAAYLFNMANTFDGSVATTVALAPTSAIPGVYGDTDGSSYINVPHLTVDNYGRIVYATTQQFTVTQGLDHAFSAILVNNSEAFTASSADSINFVAGNNVTLTASTNQMGQKTISISSSGGGGGGSSSSPSDYFMSLFGPTGVTIDGSSFSVTTPAASGKIFIYDPYISGPYGYVHVMNIYAPGGISFSQHMGSYSYNYGPNGPMRPWYSSGSVPGGTSITFGLDTSTSNTQAAVRGFVLDSSSNPATDEIVSGGGGTYSPNGDITIPNIPQLNYSLYWSNPGWCYGQVNSYGGDFSAFQAAQGVTAYYDATTSVIFFRCPASVWASGAPIGSISGFSGSYSVGAVWFGS